MNLKTFVFKGGKEREKGCNVYLTIETLYELYARVKIQFIGWQSSFYFMFLLGSTNISLADDLDYVYENYYRMLWFK